MTGAIGIGQLQSPGHSSMLSDASAAYSNSQNYFDLRSLDQIGKLAHTGSSEDQFAALQQIGGQFESMLLKQMLKSMREVNEVLFEDSYFNPQQVRFYQSMLDDQMTLSLGQSGALGIAEQFTRNVGARYGLDSNTKIDGAALGDQVAPGIRRYAGVVDAPIGLDASKSDKPARRDGAIHYAAHVSSDREVNNNKPIQASSALIADAMDAKDRKTAFVEGLLPAAAPIAQRLGLKVSQLLAQAVLETGWGEKIIHNRSGESSHNLFGIKAAGDWRGETAETLTTEYLDGQPVKVSAQFRHYASFKESFSDFFHFLTTSARYADVLKQPAEKFYYSLQSAGYATDPSYADKIYDLAKRIESSILR